MSDSTLVCGFADPDGSVAGACWRLGEESGGIVLAGDAVSAAEASVTEQGDALELELGAGAARCRASLRPRPATVALELPGGEPAGLSAAICEAEVEFELEGRKRSLDCAGHLTSWQGPGETEPSELCRHLAIPLAEDGLVVLAARRPKGAGGHDEEVVHAWRLDPEGGTLTYEEALLSTQYDEAGGQTRAGLELWPSSGPDAHPMRAAGTAIGAVEAGRATAALLRTSSEGRAGLGDYLVWRP